MKKYRILVLAMLASCSVAFTSCGDDDEVTPNGENGEYTPDEKIEIEAVDLGLPSGTLWANINMDGVHSLGDIPHNESIREWARGMPFPPRYYDGWRNGDWYVPTADQFRELISSDNTTTEWIEQNGANGLKIISKVNGNSIYLPSGVFYGEAGGEYWSTTSVSNSVEYYFCYLKFNSNEVRIFATHTNNEQKFIRLVCYSE